MKPIILDKNRDNGEFIYIQIYEAIKNEIVAKTISEGERLPSLRKLAKDLDISVTTIELAYKQLAIEGYIKSLPHSGYYVSHLKVALDLEELPSNKNHKLNPLPYNQAKVLREFDRLPRKFERALLPGKQVINPYIYDVECFDFGKWKKCMAKIFSSYPDRLLYESDPQGEAALREEIAHYVYNHRGVFAQPDEIVIGAGTQQITSHLSRILLKMNINLVSLEEPGYLPVQRMFHDAGFQIKHIPVAEDGIEIAQLPANISSAVYVSPSNQFPTGSIMPVARRFELLEWAKRNHSFIIEDDYDSELRYFGKPVPALQGLDLNQSVVYLGSFSSTLFPAIKIAYMVMPKPMAELFQSMKSEYTQTCSKSEQLALAIFMRDGHYKVGIRKLRALYAKKLEKTLDSFKKFCPDSVLPVDTKSGLSLIIRVKSNKKAPELCQEAKSIGLQMIPISQITDQDTSALSFYYSQLPLDNIEHLIKKLSELWA